jgi:hypothetical protein
MPKACGKCHRTGNDLIPIPLGDEDYDWCNDCKEFHLYQSHGWVGGDSIFDFGCPNSAHPLKSFMISVRKIAGGLWYVEYEYKNGKTLTKFLRYKQHEALIRMIVRDNIPITERFMLDMGPYGGDQEFVTYEYEY